MTDLASHIFFLIVSLGLSIAWFLFLATSTSLKRFRFRAFCAITGAALGLFSIEHLWYVYEYKLYDDVTPFV